MFALLVTPRNNFFQSTRARQGHLKHCSKNVSEDLDLNQGVIFPAIVLARSSKSEPVTRVASHAQGGLNGFCFLQVERKSGSKEEEESLEVALQPFGHYNEPILNVRVPVRPGTSLTYSLEYDPVQTGEWIKVQIIDEKGGNQTDVPTNGMAKMKI